MHGWGVTRGMSYGSQLSRSRLPLMHTYASMTSESSPLPPYVAPMSTPASRSLPLQILLALFTTIVVLSSVLQITGLHEGLHYAEAAVASAERLPVAASPTALFALRRADARGELGSDVLQDILERLDSTDHNADADVSFAVAFGGSSVRDGAFVSMDDAASAPSIAIDDSSALFTWVLVDVDAPDPAAPSHAPFLHYIVADLDAGASESRGRVVVPYFPVSPPVGEHRYVSLLFRQPSTAAAPEQVEDANARRSNFDVVAFAERRGLVLVSSAHFVSQPARRSA